MTSSPSSRPLTTTKTSLYCDRDGSTSSSPRSEHDCQSAATKAQRPGSGCAVDALRQEGDGLLGIRPVVDHEERADVVPRRVRDERRAPLGRPRNRVALERHAASSGGGSTRPAGLPALPLELDRERVEPEVRPGRERPPGVRRVPVVGVDARDVVVGEPLHVAVELDVARLLGDAHVRRDVPGDPVPRRAPRDPAPVPREMVEQVAHLPDVDDVEREVVEVGVTRLDERHHVVLRVDVEPDAGLAEPVGDLHPEHVAVERDVGADVAREVVHVTEAARAADVDGRRRARVLRPPVDLGRRAGGTAGAGSRGRPDRAPRTSRRRPRGRPEAHARPRAGSRDAARTRRGRSPARCPRRARGSTARRCTRGTTGRSPAAARRARAGRTTAPRPRPGRRPAARRGRCARGGSAAAFQDHALGLVLGDRERDVERLRRDLELLAGPGEVDVPLLDRVPAAGRGPRSRPRRRRPASSAASSRACR